VCLQKPVGLLDLGPQIDCIGKSGIAQRDHAASGCLWQAVPSLPSATRTSPPLAGWSVL